MATASTVYSLQAVTLIVAAVDIAAAGGVGEDNGEGVTIEQAEDDIGYKAAADGTGAFFSKQNRYTVIKVKALQTGKVNQLLTAIHLASRSLNPDAPTPFPVYFEDRNGTSKLVSDAALTLKLPDESYGVEPGYVEWSIGVHDPTRIVGGH
jgi:hypothetical protein